MKITFGKTKNLLCLTSAHDAPSDAVVIYDRQEPWPKNMTFDPLHLTYETFFTEGGLETRSLAFARALSGKPSTLNEHI
jgi:hypothetical protein